MTFLAGSDVTAAQVRDGRVLAALAEDRSGRMPLPPDHWDGLGDRHQLHLFLTASGQVAGPQDPCRGYAAVDPGTRTVQLTLHPDHQHLVRRAIDLSRAELGEGPVGLWVKGDRSVAAELRVTVRRMLLLLTASASALGALPPTAANAATGGSRGAAVSRIRPFDPVHDTKAWLTLNAAAFSDLPDQAGVDSTGLREQLDAPWHDPAGFLVAERTAPRRSGTDPDLIGFHWTKVNPAERVRGHVSGEVYVLGVHPDAQGTGLASQLLVAGLRQLRRRGLHRFHLFVDADNDRALDLYQRFGFAATDTDRLLEVGGSL